jgi:mRNA interferase MazF
MERFVKADVVVLPFPFSNLKGAKRRPALVLADLPGDDVILCQITSQESKDSFAIPLNQSDFIVGSLPTQSYIRTSRIFTADKKIILRKSDTIYNATFSTTLNRIIEILNEF